MGAVYLVERSDGEIQGRGQGPSRRRQSAPWRDRFLKERGLLANLNHVSIARVIDAGYTADGQPYLVMEYVDGIPIDTHADGKNLRDKLTLYLRACDGVAHAHRQLIIHRDLKPSNILVDASGQPKLLDFAIAKMLEEAGDATQTVARLLTPNYDRMVLARLNTRPDEALAYARKSPEALERFHAGASDKSEALAVLNT
jgi:serine/threonine protein kinase